MIKDLQYKLTCKWQTFTTSEQKIAGHVLHNISGIRFESAASLGQHFGVSPKMVGRFLYPQNGAVTLPCNFLLQRLDLPLFRPLCQLMMFAALLESGTGAVHAINERIGNAWGRRHADSLGRGARPAIALVILAGCMFLTTRFGLVALIANGYRLLAAIFLLVYVLPVLTIGILKLRRGTARQEFP